MIPPNTRTGYWPREKGGKYGVSSFARDIVGVADNMRRALDAVSPELRSSAQAGVRALIDGVELTERELQKALEKNGVRQFSPRGEKFDPNVHQAMFEVPNASVPAGSVVEVVQPGYMLGERVLRPAMVGVSKGGPKTAPPSRHVNDNATTSAKDSTRNSAYFTSMLSRTVRRRASAVIQVSARDPDHLQISAAAETQPLHHHHVGSRSRVFGLRLGLITGLAADAQRFRDRHPHFLDPADLVERQSGEVGTVLRISMVRRAWLRSVNVHQARRYSLPGESLAARHVAQHHCAAAKNIIDMEAGKVSETTNGKSPSSSASGTVGRTDSVARAARTTLSG